MSSIGQLLICDVHKEYEWLLEDLAVANAEIEELNKRILLAVNDLIEYGLIQERKYWVKKKERCEIDLERLKPLLSSSEKVPIIINDMVK